MATSYLWGQVFRLCLEDEMGFFEHVTLSATAISGYLLFYIYDVEINLNNEMQFVISKGNQITHAR